MSSTNRSSARAVHPQDFYATPVDKICDFLESFQNEIKINGSVLDPCAGGGQDIPMSYPFALSKYGIVDVDTIDIREDSQAATKADYLKHTLQKQPDFIITNPPFSLAMEFVEKALNDVKPGGWVVMLLRLSFLESIKRKAFFDKYMPQYIYVYHRRPSFTGHGCDSVAYAHFCWQKGSYPEFAKIKVI